MRPSRRILDRMWTESMRCFSVSTLNTSASFCVPALNSVSSRPFSATMVRMFHSVFGAHVFGRVGFFEYVQRVVPLNVEGQLIHGLQVGQVMGLLKDQNPDNRIKVFGRPSKPDVEERAERTDSCCSGWIRSIHLC